MDENQTSLTLATYNIHRCIGNDNRFDPGRIIRVINQLNADIIALQEVETVYDGNANFLDSLFKCSRMEIIPGLTMYRGDSSYGNVLLTRYSIENVEHINISFVGREPRGAIRLRTQIGSKSLQVIATHLGLIRSERTTQIKRLLKVLNQQPTDISVLMGDLNEWFFLGEPLRLLRKYFSRTGSPATFPARFPLLSLDRILVKPRSCAQSIEPLKNLLTKAASDHLPLIATLLFK